MTAPDSKLLALVADAIRDRGCGCMIDGKPAFCDDVRLEGQDNGYGKPLRFEVCECKATAQAAIAACHAEELAAALRECADDLKAEIDARYLIDGEVHPSQQRRYDRDMGPVNRAHALLSACVQAARKMGGWV